MVIGDPVTLYLARRDLLVKPVPTVLRHAPSMAYHEHDPEIGELVQRDRYSVMLAAVQSQSGELLTCHRTYLTDDGCKADVPTPKKLMPTAGPMAGAAVRLCSIGADGALGIAEGIETALAAHLASGLPVWSALSAAGLESFQWPPEVRRLIVFADHDLSGRGQQAADRLAARAHEAGLFVSVQVPSTPGDDWADVWAQRQRREASV